MKGKIFSPFCLSILSFIVLLTGSLVVNTAPAHAATSPITVATTNPDLTQTLDEIFPNPTPGSDEYIVKDALINADYADFHQGEIDGSSSLADLQTAAPRVTIDTQMTDYAPLIKVAGFINSLQLGHQSHLSGEPLNAITRAVLTRPDCTVGSLKFPHDNLTTADLKTLLSLAKEYTPTNPYNVVIGRIDLSHNNISDFSPWLAFKNSTYPNLVATLIAPFQEPTTSVTLPAQTLNGTTVKIPFANLPEMTADLSSEYYIEYTLMRASLIPETDYFDDVTNFDEQNTLLDRVPQTLPYDKSKFLINEFAFPDTYPDGADLTNMYTIGLSPDIYTPTLSPSAMESKLLNEEGEGGLYHLPSDTTRLTINHIPTGSQQLTLKIAKIVPDSNMMWTTYVQNYTIPLKPPATSNTVTSAESEKPSESTTIDTPTSAADKANPENKIVYATKKISLYASPTFTNKARIRWYTKAKRLNRPMFKVIGYARSKNGVLRYKVKDVTPDAKTHGQTGYITANDSFVSHAYYQTKAKQIKVLRGLNSYKTKALTGKKVHYHRNQVIKVKKLVTHNLTTRYQLPNGRYVSANKRLVIQVK